MDNNTSKKIEDSPVWVGINAKELWKKLAFVIEVVFTFHVFITVVKGFCGATLIMLIDIFG